MLFRCICIIFEDWCLKNYHGCLLSSPDTIFILNLFHAFQIHAASCLPTHFYLLPLHCPRPAILVSMSVNSYCHISSVSSQIHSTYHARRFFFFFVFFLYLIKEPFHMFHQVCNILMHIPGLQHQFSLMLQFHYSEWSSHHRGVKPKQRSGITHPALFPLCAGNTHLPIPSLSLLLVICSLLSCHHLFQSQENDLKSYEKESMLQHHCCHSFGDNQ